MARTFEEVIRIVLEAKGAESGDALAKALEGVGNISEETRDQLLAMASAMDELAGQEAAVRGFQALEAKLVDTAGKATELRSGNDVAIIACGVMVEMAVKASDALKAEGINARVLNMSTIKPLDTDAILKAAEETKGIVTAEEHHVTGGLGGAVAELLSQNRPTRMRIVGLGDEFAVVGPTPALRTRYGMSADNIAAKAKELL